ncbi:MAG: crotonobetainyl-CoA:carnitine CoA-transferase CaiB-like acyl-CoA transferase [Psychromonas sp.]|jgi:crotonobetainyl-CoA:carnitine CoA-transferase CaiB-like acyl-CoA transferase|uniref:CaiB/BaiF CoA transferase family protein n=1 Tax=Psychromonas sp. TaxID=1884585 RepID=UPI0039E6EB8D
MASALEGIKVVDLSRVLAGPWATQMLADLGAEVIKIEQPNRGDDTRYWGPPFLKEGTDEEAPEAAYYHCANRNKQSVAIDISTSEGQQIIKDMVLDADVLVENYKVGGLKKYGLDYQSISKLNPKIIYCSITGFGQKGPSAHKAGYDAIIQAEGGIMSLTGDGEPMKVGIAIADIMTGLYSGNAILAALFARTHTKTGQYIDIALLDVQMSVLANQGMSYLSTGENPARHGNAHPVVVPYQPFSSKDGKLILAIGNDLQFTKFCKQVERADLATDPKFCKNGQRVKFRDELIPLLDEIMSTRTTDEWIEILEKISVPCGPINTLKQVFNHPQTKYRKMVRQVPNSNGKMIDVIASPINLSNTPLQYKMASPALGEHGNKVLSEKLGYSAEKIAALRSKKIIG